MSEKHQEPAEMVARGSAWIAVQTHPHKEQVARENLHRQMFATYCPLVMSTQRRGRQVSAIRRPLFPSYVFVAVDFASQRWRPILSTLGVRSVVRIGDRPSTVPTPLIEALRSREVDGAIAAHREQLRCGQQVRLAAGALQGLVGTIIEMHEKERIVVLMQLLNQQVRVQVDRAQVAALPAE
jgi:transcriptional antiterminator RfaH